MYYTVYEVSNFQRRVNITKVKPHKGKLCMTMIVSKF